MLNYDKIILYHKKIIRPYLNIFGWILDIATYLVAVLFMLAIIYEYGFRLTPGTIRTVHSIYNMAWIVYLINITYYFFTGFRDTKKKYKRLVIILGILLYFTLLPHLFFRPGDGFVIPGIWDILHSRWYRLILLTLFSLLILSSGVVRLMGKRTNPSLILATSFFCIILIGTGLLALPRSTMEGISFIDALFVSTSAVCVTGLTPVDISATFTVEGQIIIALLIQTGGLGVMTLTSFFAVFFMGNTSIYNQLVLKDMISSSSLNSLISTLLYILGFTLVIELSGMFFIWISIHGTFPHMSVQDELFFAAFHSVSAFCNAGFSTLSNNLGNSAILTNHNTLYMTVSFLVILGGIGFPILVNFKNLLFKKGTSRVLNLNTRIVLSTTLILLITGTLLLALLEWNGAFAGMSVQDKLVQSFFNAVSPRTAGFTSVNLTGMCLQTLLIYTLFMWIGGAAQSTAGGIKVNAFAVALLNLAAVLRGSKRVEAFGREISEDSIRRSNATVFISLIVLFLFFFILTLLEPHIPAFHLLFECVSALGTVGSSLDTTQLLGDWGKLLVSLLMFIGRVGVITLMLGIISRKKNTRYRYPSDNIIIN